MYQGGPPGGFDPRYPSGAFGKIFYYIKTSAIAPIYDLN